MQKEIIHNFSLDYERSDKILIRLSRRVTDGNSYYASFASVSE